MRSPVESLLNPSSIAVIGPSPKGNLGSAVLGNLLEMRSRGRLKANIFAVNPMYESCLGVRCERDLPAAELAILAVPPALSVEYLRRAAELGYRAAIVLSGGFEEVGAQSLRELLGELRGMRVLGPNTLGVIDPYTGVNATFLPLRKPTPEGYAESFPEPRPGRVALIAQSGGLSASLYDELNTSGPGIRALVSLGNGDDIGPIEVVDYFAGDERTSVILLYLERVFGGRALMDSISRARARGKGVIVLLGGVTQAGLRAASSHTASILRSAEVARFALRQAGAYVARDMEDAMDAAKAAAMLGHPPGRRVAVLTNSGGAGVLATDALSSLGLEVPDLSRERELEELLSSGAIPRISSVRNPVDITGGSGDDDYLRAYSALSRISSVDCILLIPTHYPPGVTEGLPGKIAAVRSKPTVVAEMGFSEMSRRTRSSYDSLGMPSYPSPERAARAIYAANEVLGRAGTWSPGRAARRLAGRVGAGTLLWPDLVELLASAGLDLPEWSWLRSASEWPAGWFPAAVKVHAKDLVHKTEGGAVELDIRSPEELERAMRRLGEVARAHSGRIYAQRMVRGVELRIGFVVDEDFGLLADVGSGGALTELLGDHSTRVAPVTEYEAKEMLMELRAWPLLMGYRGSAPADVDRLARAISELSELAYSLEGLRELEVNPLIVSGPKLYAVDARAALLPGPSAAGGT